MTSILFRAGAGFAGDITRPSATVVEPGALNPAKAPTAFGVPVKIVSGKFEKIEASDTAAVFYGVLSRNIPQVSADVDSTQPSTTGVQGIVTKGYVNVVCTIGNPARGGVVYMRVVAATGKAIGDFEATADGSNNVALTGVVWGVDGKDASNVTEIRIG